MITIAIEQNLTILNYVRILRLVDMILLEKVLFMFKFKMKM